MNSKEECPYLHPAMINVAKRVYVCECGVTGVVNKFISDDGLETSDASEAVTAVIELETGMWQSVDLRDFDDGFRA